MSDTFVPDSSFGLTTCSFFVEYPDPQRQRHAQSLISTRNLPFGGGVVVQSGGVGARVYTFTLYVQGQSQLANLEAARGYHGVLSVFEGTFSCTLSDVNARGFYLDQSMDVIVQFTLDN